MKLKTLLPLFAILFSLIACNDSDSDKIYESIIRETAKEAYIYAFPAVEHNKMLWSILAQANIPANTFLADTALLTHEDVAVVSPNNDTFYSYAICDIRFEPIVIKVPEINIDRYFSIQLCDVFTNCPDYISTLATGEGPGNYLIARSDWEEETIAGINKVIKIPATLIMALARTQVFGTDDKEAAVLAQSYEIIPLSRFAQTTTPEAESLVWDLDLYDSKTGNIENFFKTFNQMVQYQLLNSSDKALMDKYKAIGLEAGREFSQSQFTNREWQAIEAGAKQAKAEIERETSSIGTASNNWKFSPANSGRWGTDYKTRAAAAWQYIYVNTPEEAVYAIANVDGLGKELSGSKTYTMTFSEDEIPDVEFFWSLTMYNQQGFLVDNEKKRYNIKDSDPLVCAEDGSLTLYIQHTNPGKEYESNWLPSPEGVFYMILRLYGPSKEAIDGTIVIPPIVETRKESF